MTDQVKKQMHKRCGVGGIKCSCCNDYNGKERKKLMRMVRRVNKYKIRKKLLDFKEEID
ncbi:MAG: hypothetical protein GQ540_03280 [Lutibacter sp.]|uniref:hypothetical protein n=1 Tax=Lutibacter sp. TaxID=1925666 RepID=UPI001A0D9CF0|nr:hypothetical protein [Lutibacter sp.]NOR27534.1 hypothetical protein [Lutibacter sp.]